MKQSYVFPKLIKASIQLSLRRIDQFRRKSVTWIREKYLN